MANEALTPTASQLRRRFPAGNCTFRTPRTFREFIEQRIALLAHLPDRARLTETVCDPLGNPTLHLKRLGQVAGVKWAGQRTRDQAQQVGGRAEPMRLPNG